MALKVQKVEVWAAELRDEPGGLSDVLGAIANAGGNLECVLARRDPSKPGRGELFVTPLKGGQRLMDNARSAGFGPANLPTLRVEGPDVPGLGARLTEAIAAVNVNLRGVTAVAQGRTFVAYFGFDNDGDADVAMRAIQDAGRTAGRGASGGGRTTAARKSSKKAAKKTAKKTTKKTTKKAARAGRR
jgi:hypothetical protein